MVPDQTLGQEPAPVVRADQALADRVPERDLVDQDSVELADFSVDSSEEIKAQEHGPAPAVREDRVAPDLALALVVVAVAVKDRAEVGRADQEAVDSADRAGIKAGTRPDRAGTKADRAGTKGDRAGTKPGRVGTKADRAGTKADRVGTKADRAGTKPGRVGTKPDRVGTKADRVGTKPGRVGTKPGRAGTKADRAGTKADRAGTRPGRVDRQEWMDRNRIKKPLSD